MHLLETLGHIRLTDSAGKEVDALLKQPKRLALLAYLASPAPGTWHRRDVLLGIFWPELDAQRARTSLRNALHVLRQHLGAEVICTRGDDDVSVDSAHITTDAANMERDAQAGLAARSFEQYRGDYLRGLFIKEAESFERWLDDERRRLLAIARKAGLAAADASQQSGNSAAAIEFVERVVDLDPHDESVVRKLIRLLDRSGDRARALAVYERFRDRLAEDLGAEASPETIALVEEIRARRAPKSEQPSTAPHSIPPSDAAIVHEVRPLERRPQRLRMWLVGAAATAAVVFVFLRGHGAPQVKRLVILPMENTAGDSLLYVGAGINDEAARIVRGIGGMETVRSAAYDVWPRALREDISRVGRAFGADVALRTRLSAVGDSLALDAELIDVDTKTRTEAGHYTFVVSDARDVSSRLAASVAGKLFRPAVPGAPHADPQSTEKSASFLLAQEGWYYQMNGPYPSAKAESLFHEATRLDPTNARAWAGLNSFYTVGAISGREEWSATADLAKSAGDRALALDSLEGTPLANQAILRALKTHRLSEPESLLALAIARDGSNPELYVIRGVLYRAAWQWDRARDAFRIGMELDRFSPGQVTRAAMLELCADRPKEALAIHQSALNIDNTQSAQFRLETARIYAQLGQWDKAVAELRAADGEGPDVALTGEAAYWAITERDGRKALKQLEAGIATGAATRARLAIARIGAGDIELGMKLLENEVKSGDPLLYRLPCLPAVDRVRGTVRFKAILAALPKWTP